MSQKAQVLRRIETLKAAMPKERPMRDSVVSQSGRERAEIAFLYLSIGDEEAAATMYVEGARWSKTCGDIMGALVLVRQALKLRSQNADALALYRELWAMAGLGDTPDPIP